MLTGQSRITRNESRVTTHQFHQPDTIHGPDRFNVGTRHGFHRFGKRGVKSKALVKVHDVIVNGLGNPDHASFAASSTDFSVDLLSSAQRSIPSDDEQ